MAGEIPIRLEPYEIDWKFDLEGRSWDADEAWPRYEMTPEKLEMSKGKLLWNDEDRLRLLGLLLENCGLRAAVHLGDPAQWRDAVSEFANQEMEFQFTVRRVHRLWDLTEAGVDLDDVSGYYNRWTTTDFVELGMDGVSRNWEERLAIVPSEYDWSHWTEWTTEIESVALQAGEACVIAARTSIEHKKPGRSANRFVERWQEDWRKAEGWKVTARKFLSLERLSNGEPTD